MVARLLATFALIAILLVAVGFYALFSYLARLREREFAIRIALGAHHAQLAGRVIGQAVRLSVLGVAIGSAAASMLSGAVAHLLFGVTTRDAATFAASALVLVATPALASYIPARRACRVDPAASLRQA